jgi:glycine dehydrogenase
MNPNEFVNRHIGVNKADTEKMLTAIGCESIDRLIEETIPSSILKSNSLNVDDALSEEGYLQLIKKLGAKKQIL